MMKALTVFAMVHTSWRVNAISRWGHRPGSCSLPIEDVVCLGKEDHISDQKDKEIAATESKKHTSQLANKRLELRNAVS